MKFLHKMKKYRFYSKGYYRSLLKSLSLKSKICFVSLSSFCFIFTNFHSLLHADNSYKKFSSLSQKEKKKYEHLSFNAIRNIQDASPSKKCDLIIFSCNRAMQLWALLESAQQYLPKIRKIAVIYKTTEKFKKNYEIVKQGFPYVHFFQQNPAQKKADFKPTLLETLFGKFGRDASYVIFSVDDIILTREIDIDKDVHTLSSTKKGYALLYRLAPYVNYCYPVKAIQTVPYLSKLKGGYFLWKFHEKLPSEKGNDWQYPHNIDFTLYKKSSVIPLIFLPFNDPSSMESHWTSISAKGKIGLCHETTKIVNIPANVVQSRNRTENSFSIEELDKKFSEGLKIDIKPLHKMHNTSAHIRYTFTFIPRSPQHHFYLQQRTKRS